MRIKDNCFQKEEKHRIKNDLISLLDQPSDKEERPCPGCRLTFDGDPDIKSTKHCSFRCPYAPQMMSSDPKKHPIEGHVVPISYAIYTTRLMMPCWSCEGHAHASGEIYKMPKVWFYSVTDFYPKLVAQYLGDLRGKHLIENEWHVTILQFSQSMLTLTYCIEPKTFGHATSLPSLQKDLFIMAKNFRENILQITNQYLDAIDRSPFL